MNVIRKFYGTGFGSLHTSQKNEPQGSPGPPFLLNSADSGLWVNPVSGKIELDGSGGLNPLLQNTQINVGGFLYQINDGPNSFFSIDTVGQRYSFGDLSGSFGAMAIDILDGSNLIQLGTIFNGIGNSSMFLINDGNKNIRYTVNATTDIFFELDVFAGLYRMGDVSDSLNGTFLRINDAGSQVDILTGAAGNLMLDLDNAAQNYQMGDISGSGNGSNIDIDDLNETFKYQAGFPVGNLFLNLNAATGQYQLGDIATTLNGSQFNIADGTKSFSLKSGIDFWQTIDGVNRIFQFGDITPAGNGSTLSINDTAQTFVYLSNVAGNRFLSLDASGFNRSYQMGDIDASNNESFTVINDNTREFEFFSIQNAGLGSFLHIDVGSKLYSIGDLSARNNSTNFQVDDTNRRGLLNAVNGLRITGDPVMIHSGTAYTNGAGANVGTLLNAPTAGNPTKWIPVDDNGTTRFIPAW